VIPFSGLSFARSDESEESPCSPAAVPAGLLDEMAAEPAGSARVAVEADTAASASVARCGYGPGRAVVVPPAGAAVAAERQKDGWALSERGAPEPPEAQRAGLLAAPEAVLLAGLAEPVGAAERMEAHSDAAAPGPAAAAVVPPAAVAAERQKADWAASLERGAPEQPEAQKAGLPAAPGAAAPEPVVAGALAARTAVTAAAVAAVVAAAAVFAVAAPVERTVVADSDSEQRVVAAQTGAALPRAPQARGAALAHWSPAA
jgi:hypothetical protein